MAQFNHTVFPLQFNLLVLAVYQYECLKAACTWCMCCAGQWKFGSESLTMPTSCHSHRYSPTHSLWRPSAIKYASEKRERTEAPSSLINIQNSMATDMQDAGRKDEGTKGSSHTSPTDTDTDGDTHTVAQTLLRLHTWFVCMCQQFMWHWEL